MARNRSGAPKRATAATTAELRDLMPSRRTPGKTSARDPAAAPFDTDDEAAGYPAQRPAIDAALARHNARLTQSAGAVGPIGRAMLVIAVLVLVGLAAASLLLAT
jgi:hypothetical protein